MDKVVVFVCKLHVDYRFSFSLSSFVPSFMSHLSVHSISFCLFSSSFIQWIILVVNVALASSCRVQPMQQPCLNREKTSSLPALSFVSSPESTIHCKWCPNSFPLFASRVKFKCQDQPICSLICSLWLVALLSIFRYCFNILFILLPIFKTFSPFCLFPTSVLDRSVLQWRCR